MMSHKEPKSTEKPSIRINGKYDTRNTIVANTATNGPTIDLFLPLGNMLGFIFRPSFCSDGLKCDKNQMTLKCVTLNRQKSKFNLFVQKYSIKETIFQCLH